MSEYESETGQVGTLRVGMAFGGMSGSAFAHHGIGPSASSGRCGGCAAATPQTPTTGSPLELAEISFPTSNAAGRPITAAKSIGHRATPEGLTTESNPISNIATHACVLGGKKQV